MGMLLTQPFSGHSQGVGKAGLRWLEEAEPERVSICLDLECLRRLLREHQLHVQDFSCADESSRACVRQLLLALSTRSGQGS